MAMYRNCNVIGSLVCGVHTWPSVVVQQSMWAPWDWPQPYVWGSSSLGSLGQPPLQRQWLIARGSLVSALGIAFAHEPLVAYV